MPPRIRCARFHQASCRTRRALPVQALKVRAVQTRPSRELAQARKQGSRADQSPPETPLEPPAEIPRTSQRNSSSRRSRLAGEVEVRIGTSDPEDPPATDFLLPSIREAREKRSVGERRW